MSGAQNQNEGAAPTVGEPPRISPAKSRISSGPSQRGIISWDVGGRIILLFTVLCLIKLTMLAGFRRHLFEIHWRITMSPPTWLDEAAFYVFVVLVGLNLWLLATRCATCGARAVRAANLCVLAVGTSFIFLTFHAGDKSYLSLIMNHTLGWWDLKAYLKLAFFFAPPFLAVWLGAYVLIYYGMARTGREQWMLHVTAICAAAYTVWFLRDLMSYRNALLAADCIGIACLLAGLGFRHSLKWIWAVQPVMWIIFLFLICHGQDENLARFNSVFIAVTGWSLALFAGASALARRGKFLPAWSWFWPFAFISFLLLTNINYGPAPNYQNLLFWGLTLPHYFLGEFLLAVGLLAAATLYRRLLPAASLLWLDGVSLLLIALALGDLRLSEIMGVRLDWQAVEFGSDLKMVWRMAKPFLPGIIAGLAVLVGLYAVLVGLWLRTDSPKSIRVESNALFLLISFLLLAITGKSLVDHDKAEGESALLLAETSPWFTSAASPIMDNKTFIATAETLGMSQMLERPAAVPGQPPRNLNVVLIFQESSYNKYLSLFNGKENTQPLLSQYQDRMELFPDFFCNFAGSVNARFAALTGLYPARDYKMFTLHRVGVKSLFEILHEQRYHCSVFDSCFFDYSGFRDFLNGHGVDAMYDADTMPGQTGAHSVAWGLREDETVGAIRAQIREYATNHQKFFLSYFPVAPHNPFDGTPGEFRKFPVKKMGDYTPKYLNELLYLDAMIASILDTLKESHLLDNTLVVITDDHGEMLGENGGPIGHGWAVTPELANIPLIIMDPGRPGFHINDTVGSQVDLLPTILDLLGIAVPPGGFYQGASLYSATAQIDRTIYLNSFQQFGILQGRQLTCGTRETQANVSGTNSSVKVFAITNNAARTIFPEIHSNGTGTPPSIFQFDEFQENLLQNYSHYHQAMQTLFPTGN